MSSETCRLIVDRESVCMGDDVSSHREAWEVPATMRVTDLLATLATTYLPPVSGFAGWHVEQEISARIPGLTLGFIYSRDHLRHDRDLCLARGASFTVAEMAKRAPTLAIHAEYLSGAAARPIAVSDVLVSAPTGLDPVRRALDSGEPAARELELMRQFDAVERESQGPRRAWLRHHLQSLQGLASAQVFAARNIRLATGDMCPASLMLAGRDLLGADGNYADVFAQLNAEQGALGITAAVLAGFEYRLSLGWRRQRQSESTVAYLNYLASQGYRLQPVEQYLAERMTFENLAAQCGPLIQ